MNRLWMRYDRYSQAWPPNPKSDRQKRGNTDQSDLLQALWIVDARLPTDWLSTETCASSTAFGIIEGWDHV